MKTEIVVARYNENLDWLKKIEKSKDIKITVYNKGQDDISIDVPFIKIPNIGRESHTYLYHIINNYDNLADQTIFCQGDSIFHSPDFLDLINKYRNKFEPVQPLTAWYWPEGEAPVYRVVPPQPILDETKNLWINNARIHVEYINNDFVTVYPYHYIENNFIKFIEIVKESYGIDNPLEFNIERFKLKNIDLDDLFPICYSAIFAINKQAIRDNSIDFYNNIMSILIYDTRIDFLNKPMDHGLFLEKLWLVIFNYKKYNKNYISLKTKDYKLEKYNLTIKNNICNFSYFNIYFQLFIIINLDNQGYTIFISKYEIIIKSIKTNKRIYNLITVNNQEFEQILKDKSKHNILLEFKNNILTISSNNNIILNFNFNNINIKYKKLIKLSKSARLTKADVYDMIDYNKFLDLLN
jgi:hypothetical protein